MENQNLPARATAHGRLVRERLCEAARRHRGDIHETLTRCALVLADEEADWSEAQRVLHGVIAGSANARLVAFAKSLLADAYVKRGMGLASAVQARDYYIDAAHAGLPRGYLGLGRWYEGRHPGFRSGAPDDELAAHFFEEGVRARHVPCAAALAKLHLRARLRPRDRSEVMGLLREAARDGDLRAAELLARLEAPAPGAQTAP